MVKFGENVLYKVHIMVCPGTADKPFLQLIEWYRRRWWNIPHVIDDGVGDDVDAGGVAATDHVGKLVPVSWPGLQLIWDRLVPGPPGRSLDVLIWGRNLREENCWHHSSFSGLFFTKFMSTVFWGAVKSFKRLYLNSTKSLGSQELFALAGHRVPWPFEEMDNHLSWTTIGVAVILQKKKLCLWWANVTSSKGCPQMENFAMFYQQKAQNLSMWSIIEDRRNSVYAWTLKVWERKGRMKRAKHSSEKEPPVGTGGPFSPLCFALPILPFLSQTFRVQA